MPCRALVIDTKPRWRGTRLATGGSISRHYKNLSEGDTLDATVLTNLKDWGLAWDLQQNKSRIVIAQRLDLKERFEDTAADEIRWMVKVISLFFKTQTPRSPGLIYIDEGMDFFGPTGNSLHGNAIQRCFRAGGEKGLSCLLGLQRPKTVNLQTLTESNILYLFHMRYSEDTKRLWEIGFPKGVDSPKEKYHFLLFRDDILYPKPIKLRLGD